MREKQKDAFSSHSLGRWMISEAVGAGSLQGWEWKSGPAIAYLAQKGLRPGAIFMKSHEPEETAVKRNTGSSLALQESHCRVSSRIQGLSSGGRLHRAEISPQLIPLSKLYLGLPREPRQPVQYQLGEWRQTYLSNPSSASLSSAVKLHDPSLLSPLSFPAAIFFPSSPKAAAAVARDTSQDFMSTQQI